jgi:hypothetical protein
MYLLDEPHRLVYLFDGAADFHLAFGSGADIALFALVRGFLVRGDSLLSL